MSGTHHQPERHVVAPLPECWRIVGVGGDRSCPELLAFIHCRNCPVLAEAARTFFDRSAPEGYLDSWRAILEEPTAVVEAGATSVLVFRLAQEWVALPATVLVEVTPRRPLHGVPHRSGTALAGIVNIRGQLQLCVSLHAVLGLAGGPRAGRQSAESDADRLLVLEQDAGGTAERWVVGVDEVAGVHRVRRTDLRAVPSTVSQASARCSSALFEWQGRTIALLDEVRVFETLHDMVAS